MLPLQFYSSGKKISSTGRCNSFAIFIASSNVGLYLLFSMAMMVCRLTPRTFAMSSCRSPASFLSCLMQFFMAHQAFIRKNVPTDSKMAARAATATMAQRILLGSRYSSSPAIIFRFMAIWAKP